MIKYFLLLTIFLLVSCGSSFEVGDCKEYTSSLICDDDQLIANRNMINMCVNRGGSYGRCVIDISSIGCIQETFVVCREDANQFVTYTNKSEKIKGNRESEKLKSQYSVTTSTLPDTTTKPTYDWYNEGDVE